MKRLIRFAANLYPKSWRDRYGEELAALLDETGADWSIALNVLTAAVFAQVQRWKNAGSVALLAAAALFAASWWIGQHPYVTPGTHQVFRMDSNPGSLVGFLVMLAAAAGGLVFVVMYNCGDRRTAARVGRASAAGFILYVAAVALVSLLTPRTIVSIGDGYCYDTWCIGVEQVSATRQGQNIRYTAEVRIFSDANRVTTRRDEDFLYALDEQGRRFPLAQEASVVPLDVTVNPNESLKTSLTFLAPANARSLYLTGNHMAMPWVYLYLGSDVNPFHRRTLLRVL